jgi:hypothetical protein
VGPKTADIWQNGEHGASMATAGLTVSSCLTRSTSAYAPLVASAVVAASCSSLSCAISATR